LESATFADGQLTDTLKNLANDSSTDKKVKKKLLLVLASWQDQFKSNPSMTIVAGLYAQAKHDRHERTNEFDIMGLPDVEALERDARRQAKQEREREKEKQRLEEAERKRKEKERKNRPRRMPFDFEKVVKPCRLQLRRIDNLFQGKTLSFGKYCRSLTGVQ
jgi:hypothetical protein